MKSLIHFVTVITLVFSFSSVAFTQVNPCVSQNAIRVAVLGSSTAAGSGPSTSDSAWVNRYRNYLLGLNANNEVINLAQGGYTTYKIMPTGFTPPPGRPTPDINKNITAAMALSPDAIIVNMPSNDVSSGFSYTEQIDNLDSIVNLATTNNIPIWICTTQPKNFSSAAIRQLQSDIKDTILIRYAPRTIDFWTTIALSDNSIDPNYDSGDGTHLNDAAHNILNTRVIGVNIPLDVYSPVPSVDYAIIETNPNGTVGCGDSSTIVSVLLANLGITEIANTPLILKSTNQSTGQVTFDTLIQTGGLIACDIDTFTFSLNFYQEGNYLLQAFHANTNDTFPSNDTLTFEIQSLGHPTIVAIHDTICASGIGTLSVVSSPTDTVFWYTNSQDTIPISNGINYSTNLISATTTFFAQAIRGNLFYSDSIKTSLSSNVNWNGAMFDLVANENIEIDSFLIKINTLGIQEVKLFTKAGSHIGSETNSAAWTYQGSVSVDVIDNQNYTTVPFGAISIQNSDTVGLYFQMSNSSSKLSYQTVSSPISRSTSELELITGSGISYNFGGSYFPRDLNCGVY